MPDSEQLLTFVHIVFLVDMVPADLQELLPKDSGSVYSLSLLCATLCHGTKFRGADRLQIRSFELIFLKNGLLDVTPIHVVTGAVS